MTRVPRPLLMILLAAALSVRLLVPSGWMPADGGFGIMLCPSAGPVAAAAPMAGMHGASHDQGSTHAKWGECDFASLHAAAAPPPAGASLALPLPALALPIAAPRPELGPIRAAAPPPPARGPPPLA